VGAGALGLNGPLWKAFISSKAPNQCAMFHNYDKLNVLEMPVTDGLCMIIKDNNTCARIDINVVALSNASLYRREVAVATSHAIPGLPEIFLLVF